MPLTAPVTKEPFPAKAESVSAMIVSLLRPAVLLVRHVLQPIDGLAVERFLNGDMAHAGRGCRAMPVLLAGQADHHVAGPDLAFRTVGTLHPTATGRDDQPLAKRMRMPSRAGAGLESDKGGRDARRVYRRKQRIDAHIAREPVVRAFAGRL